MSISFDSERHAELVSVLTGATASISEVLEQLESEVASLRGTWSGEARHAYDTAQARWSGSMSTLRSILEATARSSDVTGSRLAQAELDAAQIWK